MDEKYNQMNDAAQNTIIWESLLNIGFVVEAMK